MHQKYSGSRLLRRGNWPALMKFFRNPLTFASPFRKTVAPERGKRLPLQIRSQSSAAQAPLLCRHRDPFVQEGRSASNVHQCHSALGFPYYRAGGVQPGSGAADSRWAGGAQLPPAPLPPRPDDRRRPQIRERRSDDPSASHSILTLQTLVSSGRLILAREQVVFPPRTC